MKKGLFPKLLPHLIAFVVFLLVAVIYCKPALQGMVINQHDVTQWKGSIQQSEVYKQTHGQQPLWTNSMFSGMPTFQIGYPANNVVPWLVHGVLTLHLPVPIQFFFLACICFYFLCCVLRVNPYLGIFGALSFAYATYNPVIISVGHDTKMWSIAYMPALLGSILLIYDRRYWVGAGLTALFTSVLIAMNHPQIDYYLFLTIAIMTVFFIVRWIRAGQTIHLFKALGLTLAAGAIGVAVNAVTLLSTYEYQKETIRGGASEITGTKQGDATDGLDKEYAFSYSMGIGEPIAMLLPRAYGSNTPGGSNTGLRPVISEESSKTAEFLASVGQPTDNINYYWGNLGITAGPPYVGAVVCLLAFFGLFLPENRHRWWVLAATIFAIVISWGSSFMSFNTLLYDYLPMYNKFRAPSMALVIPQLVLPLLAVVTVDILQRSDFAAIRPQLRRGLIGLGGLILFLFVIKFSLDFISTGERDQMRQLASANPQQAEGMRSYFNALKDDRSGMFTGDILRLIGFGLACAALLYVLLKRIARPAVVYAGLALLTLIDLLPIATKYINSDSFVEKTENAAVFATNDKDQQILADKSYFRVFNVAGDAFSEAITSYHYNSIGGYHAVKLRIYQDLIERQLSKPQLNLPVLNMLNVKYLLQRDGSGATSLVQRNDSAAGPAWFVRNLVTVKDAASEMSALDNFDPRATAFVRAPFRATAGPATSFSGEGTMTLVKNDNDFITYKSSSPAPQFAVFSEIYYASGWKAFIDNKEVPITRVNYVLRGLPVPAGDHTITFRFEPPAYLKGRTITSIFTVLLLVLLVAGIFLEWRARHRETVTPA
ncbi:YfhO family protein [Flaviaesturariibacter amylovorans]|uniref:YfhO family protein n=1 Tax=Flaviaesturariibacter amylovorans TaxID=1084520 RepID=A0ABP8H417_9BACT